MRVEENVLRLDIAVNDIATMEIVQPCQQLREKGSADGFAQGSQLNDFSQTMGSVLKDQSSPNLIPSIFQVMALPDGLNNPDDVGMRQLIKDFRFLFEDVGEHLGRVGIVSGGKFYGVVVSLPGGEFHPA